MKEPCCRCGRANHVPLIFKSKKLYISYCIIVVVNAHLAEVCIKVVSEALFVQDSVTVLGSNKADKGGCG